jgi:ElaB/YqjD/DUF883 family membrane-anchored ribosome-binding protein
MTIQTDLEQLSEKAQRESAEAAAQVKEAKRTAVNNAPRAAEAAWCEAKTKASELQSACESYIRKEPGRPLLIALGTGFLIGLPRRR